MTLEDWSIRKTGILSQKTRPGRVGGSGMEGPGSLGGSGMEGPGRRIGRRSRAPDPGWRNRLPSLLKGVLVKGVLTATVLISLFPGPVEAQIFDRLRKKAEEALDRTSVLQRILEKPPGITTSIHDAHTEIPFLDDHDPGGPANMAALPRDARNAFFAPPGLYEMEAESFCIHAGTHGPTRGDGYSLAPLQGEMAPVIGALVRRWADHPEIPQRDVQSLIWALQARTPINELPSNLQSVSMTLLDPDQVDRLSEDVVDRAREELMGEALDRVPESVRRVAEVEAELRSLLRRGAAFEELEAAAVLAGVPPPEALVREVPALRWNYHPDGYFVRFEPHGYAQTYIQTYVPEPYLVERDAEGRVAEVASHRGVRLTMEYDETPTGARGKLGLFRGVRIMGVGMAEKGRPGDGSQGEWRVKGWTLLGDGSELEVPAGVVEGSELAERLDEAGDRRRQVRDVLADGGSSGGRRLRADLTDLAHLRTGLQRAQGRVPEKILVHVANAWQYTLCVEAGGCTAARLGGGSFPAENFVVPGPHGPAVGGFEMRDTPLLPMSYAPVPASINSSGNVAAPGNTGAQMLLQSEKSIVDRAEEYMKALGILVGLLDVVGSGSLGAAAYNALGLGGIPVGPFGIPTMLAGAMISEVTGAWSGAIDALAGETGAGGGGGYEGGGEGGDAGGWGGAGGDPGGGVGDDPGQDEQGGQAGETGGQGADAGESDTPGDIAGRDENRSDGEDYRNTPPPNPPPNPTPAEPGSGVSSERAGVANAFTESLLRVLHHTQGATDSELRRRAACQAGDAEWAERQAALAGDHQRKAALGMIESAGRLHRLMDLARSEGVLRSPYADSGDMAAALERLGSRGWAEEEVRAAGQLGITGREMEDLRRHLLAQDPEGLAGDLEESVQLWGKELRTAGFLWLALPPPAAGCR